VTELSVRRVDGPKAQRAAHPGVAELRREFHGFRELIQRLRAAAAGSGEPGEQRLPAAPEGSRPRGSPGSAAPDPEPPRQVSSEDGGAPEPEPAPLEPLGLLLGSFAGFEAQSVVPSAEPAGLIPDRLVSEVVRAIAWGGNQRRGVARIELGGERYAGTRLVVEVDGSELSLRVDAPAGVDSEELRSRLAERFLRRGLTLRDG
jgi:hypothetical protein